MANKKIKQILVGSTTYDIEDAGAAHLSTSNIFTGTNTFTSGSIVVSKTDWSNKTTKAEYGSGAIAYTPYGETRSKLISLPHEEGTIALTSDVSDYVQANPTSTGTATLTKLKIGSMVYNVPQGSTSGGGDTTYRGTAITGTSTTATSFSNSGIAAAKAGDWYINTSNGNVYQCTVAGNASTAKWVYKGTQAILEDAQHMGVGIWADDVSNGCGAFLTKDGYLDLINTANYMARINADHVFDNQNYALPNKSGTFALTDDVQANPAAAGTTTLTKLQVGSTVYTLPSGGETYEVVELTYSQTTLTDDQYATLTASPFNKIKWNGKIYDLYEETPKNLTYTANYLNSGSRIGIDRTTKQITKGSLGALTSISSYVKNSLDYGTSNTTYALSAYQGKVLNDRLTVLENASGGGGVTSVTTSGTGNAVTAASISGNTLTLTKGSTFLTSHQSLANCAKLSGSNTFTGTNEFRHTIVTNAGSTGVDVGLKVMIAAAETAPWTKYDYENISYSPNGETTIYTLSYPAKTGTLALTSDVVANPAASGTATLTKLKVGSTVYTLPSGGGGGTAGVSSIGGKTGAITLGAGLSMSNNQLVPKIKNIYLDSSDYLCIETN